MKKLKIKLLEDNTMFANVVKVFLQTELAVEMEIFSSAESFLEEDEQDFDLILLDYYLNISDYFAPSGEVVLKELKSRGKKVPVILFSDLVDDEKIKQLMGNGVIHFVPKTECLFEELLLIVKNSLDNRLQFVGAYSTINLN